MRALNILFSAALYIAGNAAALGLLAARYDGDARRSLALAVTATGAACLIAALIVELAVARTALAKRILVYSGAVMLATAVITARAIGLDGILPARGGGQSIGLGVIAANADLFGLVIGAATAACRGIFYKSRI
jgi:hypothetical protein